MNQLFGLQHRSRTDPMIRDPMIPELSVVVCRLLWEGKRGKNYLSL